MAGPAGCSDNLGDSVRSKRGEQIRQSEDDMWIGVNGGGESSSDVNMWSRQSRATREKLRLPGSARRTLWGRRTEPQPLVALTLLMEMIYFYFTGFQEEIQ